MICTPCKTSARLAEIAKGQIAKGQPRNNTDSIHLLKSKRYTITNCPLCDQRLQAIHYPGFAMLVIFAGEMIFAAQKSPSDTACYAVVVGGTAGLSHGLFLVELSSAGER